MEMAERVSRMYKTQRADKETGLSASGTAQMSAFEPPCSPASSVRPSVVQPQPVSVVSELLINLIE